MRPQDKRVFLNAASRFEAWILVRRTNPASLEYIGRSGFAPKRIDCKPKTADFNSGAVQTAGLVVDPTIHPNAFSAVKKARAVSIWKAFYRNQGISSPLFTSDYSVNTEKSSPHYGCLTCQGELIHGDYDLYDVIFTENTGANLALVTELHGQLHMRGPRLREIQDCINRAIGAPMIQHGGEAQYADHSEQAIDAFGPNGEETTILNEHSVREWYKDRFQRKTTGDSWR
jgi:hypothetical protein